MKIQKIVKSALSTALISLSISSAALQAAPLTLDGLLDQVQQGRINDAVVNADRIKSFKANKSQQSRNLKKMKTERVREEKRSSRLEDDFEKNEKAVVVAEKALRDRLGSLKELFGVLQQTAGDARGQFDSSLTQLQFKDRSQFLTDLAKKKWVKPVL